RVARKGARLRKRRIAFPRRVCRTRFATMRCSSADHGRGPDRDILRRMTEAQARALAHEWIEAWNAHDLERILAHYEDEVTLTSPVAAERLGDRSGRVVGKAALRAYFAMGLTAFPELRFELRDVMWGVGSVVLYYVNQRGTMTGEYMEVSPSGKVSRVVANYGSVPVAR